MLKATVVILALLISANAYADFEGAGSFSYLHTVNSVYDMEDDESVVFEPRKINCPRFLAQAVDSTTLPKNTHLTYG